MRREFTAAFGLLSALLMQPLMAQDLPPSDGGSDGFEIIEDSGGTEWGRYFGGTLGVVSADGDTLSRQLAALQLDINLPATDTVKTVMSIDFADFDNTHTQELRRSVQEQRQRCSRDFPRGEADAVSNPNFPEDHIYTDEDIIRRSRYEAWSPCPTILNEAGTGYIPVERETKVADDFVDFREAYVQWQPTDFATVTIGRQSLVWGQFEFLSPVGFLLPYSGTNTSPRPSRADFSFAQDAVNLSLFPSGNTEVQLIHVPQMRLESSVEENLKAYAARRGCGVAAVGHTVKCYQGRFGERTPLFPDAGDYDMSALRFTHYGDRLTFAVTALDGTQMLLDPIRDAKLVQGNCSNGTTYCYENDRGFSYDTLETFALEFSYILNPRVILKGEFTTYESRDTLSHLGLEEGGGPAVPANSDICDSTIASDFFRDGRRESCLAHIIVTQNNGQPHITNDEVFFALGFEYEGDKWFGHFQLVAFESTPSGSVDKELDRIENIGHDDDDDGDVAPIFFIGRRLGEADDGFAGFGATAFFNAYGAGFFGGWRLNESIELGGFFGSVVDVTDSGPPDEPNYKSVDDGDALAQFGISYLF